jgi:chromosome segregation ATPase
MANNNHKSTTIDDLARLINAGFNDVTNDIGEVKQHMAEVKQRLDRIEHLLLEKQKREIEDLKTRLRRLEDALAVYKRRRGNDRSSSPPYALHTGLFFCLARSPSLLRTWATRTAIRVSCR